MSNLKNWRNTAQQIAQHHEATAAIFGKHNARAYANLLANAFTSPQLRRWIIYGTNPGHVRAVRLRSLAYAQQHPELCQQPAADDDDAPQDQAAGLRRRVTQEQREREAQEQSQLDTAGDSRHYLSSRGT